MLEIPPDRCWSDDGDSDDNTAALACHIATDSNPRGMRTCA